MDLVRSLKSRLASGTHSDVKDRERRDEYFNFSKTIQHGFPAGSTCLCYSSQLSLFAVGTKHGHIKIYGAPNVEFVAQKTNCSPISRMSFVSAKNQLLSLSEDQTFCVWEIQGHNEGHRESGLTLKREHSVSGKLKKVSCWCWRYDDTEKMCVFLGTECGNVYSMDIESFDLTDYLIYQDVIVNNIPEDYKVNPGAVEALQVHFDDPRKLLIGYNKGLIVLWDIDSGAILQTFAESFRVQDLCWYLHNEQNAVPEDLKFVSAHNDGSYVIHKLIKNRLDHTYATSRMEYKPFGPFPLKPVEKVLQSILKNGDHMIAFSGGMPRSSFSDKFVLTVERNPEEPSRTKRVCFDFTSKIVDFALIDDKTSEGLAFASALLVLCDEEVVCLDLVDDDWPTFCLPYCHSLHCSPMTAATFACDIDDAVLRNLQRLNDLRKMMGNEKRKNSTNAWPMKGGVVKPDKRPRRQDVLLTGHEDGTVKFWSTGTISMDLLLTINTAVFYEDYVPPNDECDEEDNWPPFRRIGSYDPYTDDPRFALQRLLFDAASGVLVCGGSAGHVIVYGLKETEQLLEMKNTKEALLVDLKEKSENAFTWKGREKLTFVGLPVEYAGPAVKCILQLNPPAALTALACKPDWKLLAVGTSQGFGLVDYQKRHVLFVKCLLTAAEIDSGVAATEGTVSRMKSFKKSLRDSFRRKKRITQSPTKQLDNDKNIVKVTMREHINVNTLASNGGDEGFVRAVERSVEARVDTACLNSMVRFLDLRRATMAHTISPTPTLWIGTNGGELFVYVINLTPPNPETQNVTTAAPPSECQLAKHLKLRHAAPILAVYLTDSRGFDVDDRPPLNVTSSVAATSPDSSHLRLLVVSEEQLKIFHWPKLAASRLKNKLTATEGSRIRKVKLVNVANKNDETKFEPFLITMTNQGDVDCFSAHNLRCYYRSVGCVPGGAAAAVTGVLSTVLTPRGEGFYLVSCSELQRFAASPGAAAILKPCCALSLTEEPAAGGASDQEQHPEISTSGNRLNVQRVPSSRNNPANDNEHNSTRGSHNNSHNTSISNDTTLDSIRDYTLNSSTTIITS